jgi:flagellar basal body-associated protein FliL
MITTKTKTHKKRNLILIIILAVILLVTSLFTYVYGFNKSIFGWNTSKSNSSTDLQSPTSAQKSEGNAIKSSVVNAANDKSNTTDTPPAPTTQAETSVKNVQVSITTPELVQNNGVYHISTEIDAVVDSGTCILTLKQGTNIVSPPNVSVQPEAKISTCEGYDVALTHGTWQATLSFSNSSLEGTATSQLVTVN